MTLMWVIMTMMAMAGAMLVLLPLLKFRPRKDVSSEVMNSLLYRDRLQELEADLQQGRVEQTEFSQLKSELELTLLEDVAVGQKDQGARSTGGKAIMWPLLVLIPVLALGLYWKEGFTPEVKGWLASEGRNNQIVGSMLAGDFGSLEKQKVELPELIRALQGHVQKSPNDARSWYLLGVSYMQVRMPEQAELAFTRALSLDESNVDYVLGYTQASVMLNGELTPHLRQTVLSIIQRHPENPKPYMTLGMAAFQGGDFAGAIEIWERYLHRPDPDEKAADLLQRSIDVAKKQMESAGQSVAESGAADTSKPTLKVTVTIAEDVRKQVSSSDTLFIYAKAVNGPPMPLAVVRQPVGNWPVETQLSDANAMTPMATLSKFNEVVVQARISSTGNAIPQSGDWIGPTQVLKLQPGEQSVALVISSRMP